MLSDVLILRQNRDYGGTVCFIKEVWIVLLMPELVIYHAFFEILDRELMLGLGVNPRPFESLRIAYFRMGEFFHLDLSFFQKLRRGYLRIGLLSYRVFWQDW